MIHQKNVFKRLFHILRRNFAAFWLSRQPAFQIAITGSQGKTNTTHLISALCKEMGSTVTTDINLDTIYNVPITALKVLPWTKYAVFELGVDKPSEMNYHLQIMKPKIAVITGISPVHTDKEHMGSLDTLIKEKRKLIERLSRSDYTILNWDDVNVRSMAPYTKASILWYGNDKDSCNVWFSNVKVTLEGTSMILHDENKNLPLSSKLIGKQHVYTFMIGYLISSLLHISKEQFIRVVENLMPLKGRMSMGKGPLDTIILNDSLRANPTSTAFGLETFAEIEYKKGRKIAVLGEMGELENPEKEHMKIGELIAKLPIDYILCIGPLQEYVAKNAIKNGMNKDCIFILNDVFDAADILRKIIKPNDFIYLKSSLLRHIERVLLLLKGKNVTCKKISCKNYFNCMQCKELDKS